MAIELTARLVVSKKDLQAAGVHTDTDQEISAQVVAFLHSRLPYEITDAEDQLTVGVKRKVKKDTGV